MIDNLQDIKELIQEEKEQEKTEQELLNNLIKYLYNIFDTEIKKELLAEGFKYFNYNETRKTVCNELAENQKEYDFYFMNYDKALKQIKNIFKEDVKRIEEEKKQTAFCVRCGEKIKIYDNFCIKCGASQTIQKQTKTIKEKKKYTIFGVNPIVFFLFLPVVLFFQVLDQTK